MSSNSPYPPDQGQPPQSSPQNPPTQQYPAPQPTQQYPQQNYPQQYPQNYSQQQPGEPQRPAPGPEKGGNRQLWMIVGAVVATAVVVLGLVFAVQALKGDGTKSAATATPSPTRASAAPSATTAPTTKATGSSGFPKGYAVHDSGDFGFQKPSGWVVKDDANSKFFPDAPIIETADANVAYWSNPSVHPDQQGFSVTDLTGTATTPADFINKLAQTTQRPYCQNYQGYAVSFTRGDWVGQKLESGLCSDNNTRSIIIAATRQSDNAKIGVLIRGADPTSATENQAMNAFDTYRQA